MASFSTTNYQLCQWEPTDQVQRTDFNADNAKIDTALAVLATGLSEKADQSALTALTEQVAQKAETADLTQVQATIPKLVVGTYTGTGLYGASNPCTLDFSSSLGRPPLLVIVKASSDAYTGQTLLMIRGAESVCCYSAHAGTTGTLNWITWSGNQVSWYGLDAGSQLNYQRVYRYFAVG